MLSSVSKLMVFNFLSFLSQIIEKLKKYPNTLLAHHRKVICEKQTIFTSAEMNKDIPKDEVQGGKIMRLNYLNYWAGYQAEDHRILTKLLTIS
mgnify:CR=1 FL=1